MAIDKALYQAPIGIDEAAENETPIEIEIENPESVKIGIDGLEVILEPEEESEDDFNANLAEYVNDGELAQLAATSCVTLRLTLLPAVIGSKPMWMV